MFLGKIYGYAQRQLFLKLYTMYETGFSSLLKCPSIQVYISESLTNEIPKPMANNNKPLLAKLFMHLEGCCSLRMFNLQNVLCTLKNVKKLLSINLTQIQALMVQKQPFSCFNIWLSILCPLNKARISISIQQRSYPFAQ